MRFFLWERLAAPLCSMVNYVIDPHRVIQNVVSAAMKYTQANSPVSDREAVALVDEGEASSWQPPKPGYLKLNIDGAWMKERKKAGLGAMIRNEMGILCGEVSAPTSVVCNLLVNSIHRCRSKGDTKSFNRVV
ncbi:hypothetical protein GBA52_020840 [Prunus armeniaca]|nr:hypothetical protein GBA52_020840 [Prunus armeniaca]